MECLETECKERCFGKAKWVQNYEFDIGQGGKGQYRGQDTLNYE